MIVFDLKCGNAHVFEAWFGSSGDYEAQRERGLIACPLCDDAAIEKAVMAPAVGAKGNRTTAVARSEAAAPVASGGDSNRPVASGGDRDRPVANGDSDRPVANGGDRDRPVANGDSNRPVANGDSDRLAEMLQAQRAMEAQSDYVGRRFAAEARAIHEAGETRAIYGEATASEARALIEDGIGVMPLPFRPRVRSDA